MISALARREAPCRSTPAGVWTPGTWWVETPKSTDTAGERSLALIVLDTMAGLSSATPLAELPNLCKYRDPSLADEQLREVLTVLTEDHYIEPRKGAGGAAYDFRWQLVKKWWKERRS